MERVSFLVSIPEIPKDIGKNKFEQRLSEKYKNNEEGGGSKDEAL